MIALAITAPAAARVAWWVALLEPTDRAAAAVWIATIVAGLAAWRWGLARSATQRR